MSATAATTPPEAQPIVTLDKRRITEHDADYRRLHVHIERVLWAGLHAYARALRDGPVSGQAQAASAFIQHQTKALQTGYLAGHWEGERDYWHAFSARHSPQAHTRLSQTHGVGPEVTRMRRALMFYGAASVAKMAREGQAAWAADQRHDQRAKEPGKSLSESPESAATIQLDAKANKANAAMDAWLGGLTARVALQADVTWTGLQDGYLAAGTVDPANPYAYVWWMLEPSAAHCPDCPEMAQNSPYTAPGSGGNELPQTPGDGGTDCGAACKCSLQYGSSQAAGEPSDYMPQVPKSPQADTSVMDWPGGTASPPVVPEGMGQPAAPTQVMPGRTPPPPPAIEPWRQIAQAWKSAAGEDVTPPTEPAESPRTAPTTRPLGQSGSSAETPQVWQTIADALAAGTPPGDLEPSMPIAAPPADGAPLNEGQKAALDLFRRATLAWDAVRGGLPELELFVNPDAEGADAWQNISFEDLTPEQIHAYALYIDALREWADSSPFE